MTATPSRRPSFTLGSTVRAVAVATLAVAAAVSLKRSAARAHGGALPLDVLMAGQWSTARLQNLAAPDFHRLCAAYYQRRRFRLRGARVRGNTRDAALYFGTLPHPVAIVRAIAGAQKVDVGAISDLADAMSRYAIGKSIVHAPGGYTDAAMAYARANRIRLVSGDDFGRNIAGTAESSPADETAALQP